MSYKFYEIQVWVNRVKHYKLCADCKREGKCLKGVDMDACDKHCDKQDTRERTEEELN